MIKYLRKYKLIHLIDKSPFKLSMGEARILSILLAIAWGSDVLIIDELTTGLDIYENRKLAELLLELNIPIIIASRDIDFVLEIADNVAVMNKGTIIAYGNTLDIFYDDNILKSIRFPTPVAVLIGKALGRRIRRIEEIVL